MDQSVLCAPLVVHMHSLSGHRPPRPCHDQRVMAWARTTHNGFVHVENAAGILVCEQVVDRGRQRAKLSIWRTRTLTIRNGELGQVWEWLNKDRQQLGVSEAVHQSGGRTRTSKR